MHTYVHIYTYKHTLTHTQAYEHSNYRMRKINKFVERMKYKLKRTYSTHLCCTNGDCFRL